MLGVHPWALTTYGVQEPFLKIQVFRFVISMLELDCTHVHDIVWVSIHD